MDHRERYRELLRDTDIYKRVPLFARPYWLDAVAKDWNVCLAESQGRVIAALPYCLKGKLLTRRIYLPDLSFYQSPVMFTDLDPKQQEQAIKDLFRQLPLTARSYFKFLPEYAEADLSSSAYQKESYSSYMLFDPSEYQLSKNHERNVKKGMRQHYVIRESKDLSASFALLSATFERQQLRSKIKEAEFLKIVNVIRQHGSGQLMDCLNETGELLASAFLVHDGQSVYYLMGGYAGAYKNSGGMTFLLHDRISDALQRGLIFNFCGSSRKSIAHYFEGFGARPIPISIWKKGFF